MRATGNQVLASLSSRRGFALLTQHQSFWEQRGEADEQSTEAASDVGEFNFLALAWTATLPWSCWRIKEGRVMS